ncbi:hypothetical protein, partial [Bradyrhizobium sp.]|uniref:hypothetical protein n=1 Tax=Bradyrhizobium sp. TaxID=376 RepID=UPI003C744304
ASDFAGQYPSFAFREIFLCATLADHEAHSRSSIVDARREAVSAEGEPSPRMEARTKRIRIRHIMEYFYSSFFQVLVSKF